MTPATCRLAYSIALWIAIVAISVLISTWMGSFIIAASLAAGFIVATVAAFGNYGADTSWVGQMRRNLVAPLCISATVVLVAAAQLLNGTGYDKAYPPLNTFFSVAIWCLIWSVMQAICASSVSLAAKIIKNKLLENTTV